MKTPIALAAALSMALGAVMPAAAAEDGIGARLFVRMLFQTGDTNGDGRLDSGEIEVLRIRAFQRADANGDGVISKAEMQKAAEKRQRRADMARMMGEERIDQFDTNGDGSISRAEFQSAPRPGFAMVDVNADGAIDRAEIDRIAAILAEAR